MFLAVVLFLSISIENLFALELIEGWRFRAREHYETHSIKKNSSRFTYQGFSNTINFWKEDPHKLYIGLAAGPVLGSAKGTDGNSGYVGGQIKLYSAGVEAKYLPFEKQTPLFIRLGTGWSQLKTSGTLKRINGYHVYAGLGYEIFIGESFAFSPEMAIRESTLAKDVNISSVTPSLGLHFYSMF